MSPKDVLIIEIRELVEAFKKDTGMMVSNIQIDSIKTHPIMHTMGNDYEMQSISIYTKP